MIPCGYAFTEQDADGQGIDGESNSDIDGGTGCTEAFVLGGGEFKVTIGAGLVETPATVSGSVKMDEDGDGIVDAEDTVGIAGATLLLVNAAGDTVASEETSATGAYTFYNVRPGSYTVALSLPAGYINTCDSSGANDLRIPLTLTSAETSTNNAFYVARTTAATAAGKVLYLSNGQTLDRIDPVATSDQTTALTDELFASAVENIGNSSSSINSSSLTFSHTVGTGTNRLLLVGIAIRSTSASASSVTYGGAALTQVGSATRSGTPGVRMYMYRLLDPSAGTANVVVTLDSQARVVAGASSFSGVDQTTPLGTFVSNTGSSSSPDVTLSASAGELVFDTVAVSSGSTATANSGQTQLWENDSQSNLAGGGSTKAGASGMAMGWSTGSGAWAIGAVPIRPAQGTATFVQSPVFALPFALASGAVVRITNYVTVTSGTMPANPVVSARLSVGGTAFLTLTNAAYASANGALVWSGTTPSAVSIAAGQAISLVVSNAQSGVGFKIRYDSATYPSKIVLPTASIIAVPSLGVYSAAYPDGVPETFSPISATRYARVTATDPFGSADITGVDLVIDGPGASGDAAVSLADAQMVASDAWSKTYEYAWTTASATGTYAVVATAHEGTEGVTATATVSGTLYKAAVGGRVFIDYNGNGEWDEGEGVSGVAVTVTGDLLGGGETQSRTVSTGVDGLYLFDGLYASSSGNSVSVSVSTNGLPSGITLNTVDPDGGGDSAAIASLTLSSPLLVDVEFGYRSSDTYAISGTIRIDADRDQTVSSPDVPYMGAQVRLYTDPNGDGDFSDGILVYNGRTASDGSYGFDDLIPGSYVVIVLKNGGNEVSDALPVVLDDGDSEDNGFLVEVDPSGFLYDTTDGHVVSGGKVSVLGTNAVILIDGTTGEYMFIGTNGTPTVYTIVVTPPSGYVVDPVRAAQTGVFDPSGYADPIVLGSGLSETNKNYLVDWSAASNTYYLSFELEAGDPRILNNNIPLVKTAAVYGYLFADRNGDLVRDGGDATVTNALVRLVSGGTVCASTNTDAMGYYWFGNVLPGTVTVLVSRANSTLCAVPTGEPAASDPARNRALPDSNGADAYIVYDLAPGYGTTESLPGETLNVGYAETSLSTALDVKLYASGSGGTVSIEIRTVDESGTGDIVVYAWIDNAWVEVGRVSSSEVVGEGDNLYTVAACGLAVGSSYYLRIVDESGHVHDSALPVVVGSIEVQSIRLDMQTAYVTFTTDPGCRYVVKVCESLSANDEDWTVEYVSRLKGSAWSAYSDQSFMAGTGSQTVVRIPINRRKAFFKIVRVDQ